MCASMEHHVDGTHWPDTVLQWWRREKAAADAEIEKERMHKPLIARIKMKLTNAELAALKDDIRNEATADAVS